MFQRVDEKPRINQSLFGSKSVHFVGKIECTVCPKKLTPNLQSCVKLHCGVVCL